MRGESQKEVPRAGDSHECLAKEAQAGKHDILGRGRQRRANEPKGDQLHSAKPSCRPLERKANSLHHLESAPGGIECLLDDEGPHGHAPSA